MQEGSGSVGILPAYTGQEFLNYPQAPSNSLDSLLELRELGEFFSSFAQEEIQQIDAINRIVSYIFCYIVSIANLEKEAKAKLEVLRESQLPRYMDFESFHQQKEVHESQEQDLESTLILGKSKPGYQMEVMRNPFQEELDSKRLKENQRSSWMEGNDVFDEKFLLSIEKHFTVLKEFEAGQLGESETQQIQVTSKIVSRLYHSLVGLEKKMRKAKVGSIGRSEKLNALQFELGCLENNLARNLNEQKNLNKSLEDSKNGFEFRMNEFKGLELSSDECAWGYFCKFSYNLGDLLASFSPCLWLIHKVKPEYKPRSDEMSAKLYNVAEHFTKFLFALPSAFFRFCKLLFL